MMALVARAYQGRDKEFDDKGFFIEGVALLIHKKDVQAFATTAGPFKERRHRYLYFSRVALPGEVHLGMLQNVSIMGIEGRAHLDMHHLILFERT